jgi:hypothetical protein
MSKFTIPPEFETELVYRPCQDERTDDEIITSITEYEPVDAEKNVWCFWDKGFKAMPKWCQRNVIDWVRLLGSGWTVRVLDSMPDSPSNALKYLPADNLPASYVRQSMDGPYKGPHACDMLRGACLYLYGGVFMDVGCILIRHLDRICWDQLEDPNSPFQVSVPWMYGVTMANHFVAARKGDPFIKRWHDLFVHLWRNRDNHEGLIQEPLIAYAQKLSFDDSRASNYHWDFKVPAQTVAEYITQVVCWMRVCMLEEDPSDGFNGVEYWQKNVLIWDVLPENWGGEALLGFPGSGDKMFNLFSVRLDADPNSEEYKQAYALTWRLLTKSSMQKITHGKNLTNSVHLGVLWDEHPGSDCEPGTFAELLRYGTVNFEQTRASIAYEKAPAPAETLKKGLLEE